MATIVSGATEISKENYNFLQQYVYRSSGIVLDENKHYLLEARLMPIVRRESLKSLNDLCALIRATKGDRVSQDVVEAMTTNETLFFRDAVPFKVMREKLIPEMREKRKDTRKLSFWSAASSSGQEAYSLAMMLTEMGLEDWNIEIVGTDLSDQMVQRARAGSYMQIEVNRGLPATHLVRYFERHDLEWRIKDSIRRIVPFERFDLRNSMAHLGRFDFVFCRNVLIYFDLETKKNIFRELERVFNPGGYMLLGAAETTVNLTDEFERRGLEGASFYRKK